MGKKTNLSSIMDLWPFIRPYRIRAIFACALMIGTAAISLILPVAAKEAIDAFTSNIPENMAPYFIAAIGLVLLLALTSALRYYLVTSLGERVIADIRSQIFAATLPKSPHFFQDIAVGEILSRITTDTTLILTVISSSVSVAVRNVLICIGGIGLMVWTAPKLSALVLLLVPAVILPIVLLGRKLRGLSRDNQDWLARSSETASEMLHGLQSVQSLTYEHQAKTLFDGVNEGSFTSAIHRIRTRAIMTALIIFVVFSGIVGILWIAASDLQAGNMTTGTMVQFIIYSAMVASATGILSEVWSEIQRATGASERLIELIKAKDSLSDPTPSANETTTSQGAIALKNLSFAYPNRPETLVLDGLNLHIPAGQTVALVGPSGSGKSTLFQLLLRFYDPDQGSIYLDGQDLRQLKRTDFRQHIALVPQDPVIFSQTVLENIRMGAPGATDAQVKQAAKSAAADDFINAMADGYHTQLGPQGSQLSGGQTQRIAIARAILRDASLLLLDEATSALDAESESTVQNALKQVCQNRTTIIIAHRFSTIKNADCIIVLDHGKIVAQGTHAELIETNKLYNRLTKLQYATALSPTIE